MKSQINKKYISDQFLAEFFPERDGQASLEIYLSFKNTENQSRRASGKPILNDYDFYEILTKYSEL